MSFYRHILRPILFKFDPEKGHDASIWCLGRMQAMGAAGLLSAGRRFTHPSLKTQVMGLSFANPIGLAAGFDKSGRAVRSLAALGFGHIEIGSISADVSRGNPKPRLFRLIPDDVGTLKKRPV